MTQPVTSPDSTAVALQRLLDIMRALRDPEQGCPWDRKQTFDTIAPYTLEETYEVLDAIARKDFDDLRDELGDLLFQVVFYAQMGQEQGLFTFDDVCHAISDKLERRHPHVFSDTSQTSLRRRLTERPLWRAGNHEKPRNEQKKHCIRHWTIFLMHCPP